MRDSRILAAILACSLIGSVAAEADESPGPSPLGRQPHAILFLGTFHFEDPGLDEHRPGGQIDVTSDRRQRELEEIVEVLARFRPTKIAVEVRSELQPDLDRAYAEYRHERSDLSANEVHQIGFRLARRLGHEKVFAIDAEGRWYQPYVNPEEYARSHGQETIIDSPWYAEYEAAARREDQMTMSRSLGETLLALNDPERIRRSHGVYLVGTFEVGVGPEYPGADAKTAWYNRNLRIFANIKRLTPSGSERILVVIGSGHLPILRHSALSSPEYELVEVASLLGASRPALPTKDIGTLLGEHSYDLGHDGRLSGAGLDFLLGQAAKAQFVALGEPHNTDQVNQFTTMLLEVLEDRLGFDYLVTEQDDAVMRAFSRPGVRGDLAAIRKQAALYPESLHFRTDAELALLAAAGRISDVAEPIWGVDRVLDAHVSLERLLHLATSRADRAKIRVVLAEAKGWAPDSHGGRRFISQPNSSLASLLEELTARPGSEAAELLHAIRVSREDLMAYEAEHEAGQPWGFHANERREELMKIRFLARYRRAMTPGRPLPKAVVKLGHWHAVRGLNPGGVLSFGNLLVELSRFNRLETLAISIQPVNHPGRHWSITDHPEYAPLRAVADPERWRIVDLRPLRGEIHLGTIAVSEELRQMIFGHDLLLLAGGTDPGSVTWASEPLARVDHGLGAP